MRSTRQGNSIVPISTHAQQRQKPWDTYLNEYCNGAARLLNVVRILHANECMHFKHPNTLESYLESFHRFILGLVNPILSIGDTSSFSRFLILPLIIVHAVQQTTLPSHKSFHSLCLCIPFAQLLAKSSLTHGKMHKKSMAHFNLQSKSDVNLETEVYLSLFSFASPGEAQWRIRT